MIYALLAGAAFLLLRFNPFGDDSGGAASSEPLEDEKPGFDTLFKRYGAIYFVDPRMLKAIAMNESSLGQEKSVKRGLEAPTDIEGSKSFDGLSWGLMQVTIRTARDLDPSATEEKLNNAEYSIKLAAKYLGQLKGMFSAGDPRFEEWVVKSYNQGPGNTRKEIAGSSPGYAHEYWARYQRNYVKAVL